MADWNALMGAPNAGMAFLNAFERGREQRRQDAMQKQQMEGHQQDRALRQKQIEAQIAQSGLEQHREAIKTGAAIIRQVKPQDQAGWDRALGALQQYGINPDQAGVPRQFSPEYASQIVSLADVLDPHKGSDPTSFEEYQRAQSDPEYAKFLENRRGPIVANNGDGTFTIIPRNSVAPQQAGASPPPQAIERLKANPNEAAQFDEVFGPGASQRVLGGPTQPASGGFPSSGY